MILADVSIGFCVVIDDSNVSGCRAPCVYVSQYREKNAKFSSQGEILKEAREKRGTSE